MIKAYAAENKEQLAEEFTENISRRGAQVHFAEDGKKVVDILTDIAKRRDAEVCVKSKSMATEEISLNQRMHGVMEMVETDLGDGYIHQRRQRQADSQCTAGNRTSPATSP